MKRIIIGVLIMFLVTGCADKNLDVEAINPRLWNTDIFEELKVSDNPLNRYVFRGSVDGFDIYQYETSNIMPVVCTDESINDVKLNDKYYIKGNYDNQCVNKIVAVKGEELFYLSDSPNLNILTPISDLGIDIESFCELVDLCIEY